MLNINIPVDAGFIYVAHTGREYRTLDEIKALIELAKTKNEDLSKVYIKQNGGYIISLNMLIVSKIISHTRVDDEVLAILEQLDPDKEYIKFSRDDNLRAGTLVIQAYSDYEGYKETALQVLEYLLAPEREGDHNPIADGEKPLLYVAIEEAAHGDAALCDLYIKYIRYLKTTFFAEHAEDDRHGLGAYIIEKLGLNTMVDTGYGTFNALQWVAYKYEGQEENSMLEMMARRFISYGMDPYQKVECEGEEKDFFGISVPTDGGNGWTPADFGLEEVSIVKINLNERIILVVGSMLGGVILPLILRGSGIMNNLPFPAENLIICFGSGVASTLLTFAGLMIYEAATSEELNWKKAGMNALLSFVATTVIVGGQELAHHFLPKLPECTIPIYIIGAIGIGLLHALAVPAITEKVVN